MKQTINTVTMTDEFRICPVCGYTDGFHSMFRREKQVIKWLFICPSCHECFDIGFTTEQSGDAAEGS